MHCTYRNLWLKKKRENIRKNNTDLIGSEGNHVHMTIFQIAWFARGDTTNHVP